MISSPHEIFKFFLLTYIGKINCISMFAPVTLYCSEVLRSLRSAYAFKLGIVRFLHFRDMEYGGIRVTKYTTSFKIFICISDNIKIVILTKDEKTFTLIVLQF